MAFRASNVIPSTEYAKAKQLALQMRNLAVSRSNAFALGGTAAEVLAVADNLRAMRDRLAAYRTVPGIGAYATAQEDDPAYDVAGEFNGMLAAADAVITEIVTTIPKDGNGFLLTHTINPDGSLSPRNFSSAQLSGLRNALDALAASVA